MTSSWLLSKRKEMFDTWSISNFGDPDNSLGGWEDHYIINGAVRECRAGFKAIPIGNPYGFMICKRMKRPDGRSIDTVPDPIDPSQFNGYNKFSPDLYRPWRKTAIQMTNPTNYYDRTIPNSDYLHQRDYISRDTMYNATGIKPIHTPGPRKYVEYGFGFTPDPPYKYDIHRLNQAYPNWKREQKYHGMPEKVLNELDQTHLESVTGGTF